jgi:hypothetical protein
MLLSALAEAKKPEHCQDYDHQTNNIDESIHDVLYEVAGVARRTAADLLRLLISIFASLNVNDQAATLHKPNPF